MRACLNSISMTCGFPSTNKETAKARLLAVHRLLHLVHHALQALGARLVQLAGVLSQQQLHDNVQDTQVRKRKVPQCPRAGAGAPSLASALVVAARAELLDEAQ